MYYGRLVGTAEPAKQARQNRGAGSGQTYPLEHLDDTVGRMVLGLLVVVAIVMVVRLRTGGAVPRNPRFSRQSRNPARMGRWPVNSC